MNSNLDTLNFTPAHYDMDPSTEDLLGSGNMLEEGMVVLIESAIVKESPNTVASRSDVGREYAMARLKEANRWCEVTQLSYSGWDGPDTSRLVKFVGVYADGTKRQRTYSTGYAWFVKKDSLPKPAEPENTEATEQENMEDYSDTIRYAEGDAEATMTLFPRNRALVITPDQLERVGEAVREIVPEAAFECENGVCTLEFVTDEPDVTEHENAENTEGTSDILVNEDADGLTETDDLGLEEGPMARALRFGAAPPMLREERTVTEHVKVYGPSRFPFYDGRRRY